MSDYSKQQKKKVKEYFTILLQFIGCVCFF